MNIETVLTPAEIAGLSSRDLSETVSVVFDVLRATSTIVTALFNGAVRIYPVASVADATALRDSRLPHALLGGERHGLRLDGFDLGNSPREYVPEIVAGRDIITTTTNGTVALRACAASRAVLTGALLNLNALTAYLAANFADAQRILLVCAGTGDRFALEDGLVAGALAGQLTAHPRLAPALDDASYAMIALHKRWRHSPLAALQASENGRRLTEIGLDGDIEWCARESPLPWIAIQRDGALVGEKVAPPAV